MGDIFVEGPVLKDEKLKATVSTSNDLDKYLKNRELFIEYDSEVYADTSILNIPLTATMLPLAWLTGSDIHVDSLDRTFKESMEDLKHVFKEMYPKASFNTEIIANEIVNNKIGELDPERKTGLLFSGGADSMYSLLTNMKQNPRLLMLWGTDNFPYPEHSEHWEKTIAIYQEFAERKKLDLHIIKTNISQILNDRRLEHRFHKELYNGMLRFALQHSLVLLPTVAPLSTGRFDHMIIASTFIPSYDFSTHPRAAVPNADEKIIWADLTLKHDGYPASRNDKILGKISNHLKNDNLTLRVCLRSPFLDGNINDSTCEKCFRTIASLSLAGIDPNTCGFSVDESTFIDMKTYWEKANFSHPGYHWTQIKNAIPLEIEHDLFGSKKFFDWFRDFDFKTTQKVWFFTDLYNLLPYQLARPLDMFYKKFRINVHVEPVIRK